MQQTLKIEISGIVQGVGFRPFIYQLAHTYQVNGYVTNTSQGVTILAQGEENQLREFLTAIPQKKPPLAHIHSLESYPLVAAEDYDQFTIEASVASQQRLAGIPADVAVCQDCLQELFAPDNRRYRYPFINCTNCGPRYTIIRDLPYDRPFTAMASFPMCPQCQEEYDNPLQRRFHAQPNACWKCGPRLMLYGANGKNIECGRDPIPQVAQFLREGKIIAIKGLGGFHLAVDATNEQAVQQLRERKHRYQKPLAVMFPNISTVAHYVELDEVSAQLLQSHVGPIVLIPQRKDCQDTSSNLFPIAESVAPGQNCWGVMLPYTPLHHLLMQEGFPALVMTSGNMSEEPIICDNQAAMEQLNPLADYLLLHNREIYCRCDDSVQTVVAGHSMMIRRSRGYTPKPILLGQTVPCILACGAELKNTICITRQDQAFVSQHLGDLENYSTWEFFQTTIRHLQDLLQVQPIAIAHDLHPTYFSTQYATKQHDLPTIAVQHHFAHIVSNLAENNVQGDVLGIAMDGTGYGLDGQIWGGEFLRADCKQFTRLAHFQYILMPGGEACIRYPWRMALSYLYALYQDKFWDLRIPLLQDIPRQEIEIVQDLIHRRWPGIQTSSCGRLFDAMAAILGLTYQNQYEGHAAIALEMAAWPNTNNEAYILEQKYILEQPASQPTPALIQPSHQTLPTSPPDLSPSPSVPPLAVPIPFLGIVRQAIEDYTAGTPVPIIAHRFHNTLANMVTQIAIEFRELYGLRQVALSGGVFQNRMLTQKLTAQLRQQDFTVYLHQQVPTNDAGISLGQAMIAANQFFCRPDC